MIERELPTSEAHDLIAMVREFADAELAPRAAAVEASGEFPRDVFATVGKLGLLGLPYPERFGGGEQPATVYLQVLEELAARWATVALGISVHTLSCFPLIAAGTPEQQRELLPDLLGGDLLGAYCLSEPHSGSDPGAMRTTATRDSDGWILHGEKAWVTHGGVADFYTSMVRTSTGANGISCFHVPAGTSGLTAAAPEKKMGLTGSTTASMLFDRVSLGSEALVGAEGQGLALALEALDTGRLGIAASAVGVAQAALDYAVRYAKERESFGVPIIEHQGLTFLLADMDAAVESARATYLSAARAKDAGRPFSRKASIAKLIATDAAMRVCTDAVQVLGGAGYTKDHPVERYMREVKVMQIFEGTNQIQRLVIGRHLQRGRS